METSLALNQPLAEVLDLTPSHALVHDGFVKVQRPRGRPKKVERKPDLSAIAYAQNLNALRRAWVDGDALVSVLRTEHPDVDEVVQEVRLQIARECASLKFDIEHAAERGRDPSPLSVRRLDGLSKLASLELARLKLGQGMDDPRSPKSRRAIQAFVALIEQALDEHLEAEAAAVLKGHLARAIERCLADPDIVG
jgi:hypothetical protein